MGSVQPLHRGPGSGVIARDRLKSGDQIDLAVVDSDPADRDPFGEQSFQVRGAFIQELITQCVDLVKDRLPNQQIRTGRQIDQRIPGMAGQIAEGSSQVRVAIE